MKIQRALKWAEEAGKDNTSMHVVLDTVFPDTYYGSEIVGNRLSIPPHLAIYVTKEDRESCPMPDKVLYSEKLNEVIAIYFF